MSGFDLNVERTLSNRRLEYRLRRDVLRVMGGRNQCLGAPVVPSNLTCEAGTIAFAQGEPAPVRRTIGGGREPSPKGTKMDIERACWSKQICLSKAAAKRVARDMSRRHREALHLYRWYYHVGHILPAHLQELAAAAAIRITGSVVS